MQMWIKGGKIIDPGHIEAHGNLMIKDGRIAEIEIVDPTQIKPAALEAEIPSDPQDTLTIDAHGKIVTPGLVDIHVHLREPGHEHKETIQSGALAAVAGGFTAVCCMPNTDPVNDNRQVTEYIKHKAKEADAARVYPVGAISKGLAGNEICEFDELKQAGIVALTDDGMPVMDSHLMRRAMEYAQGFDLPIVSHSENLDLAAEGVMNEGPTATRLGLAGIPNAAESIMVMREIALSELTGTRLHIAHVSTAEAVRAIRSAKARGVAVTAETAPHYFTLTDEAVAQYATHAKMNPPLRSAADRDAIIAGLVDGTLDAIATDHAPHSSIEKDIAFDQAANGIIGLETALPVSLQLVEQGVLTWSELIRKMSINPAAIMGLESGLQKGRPADITIIDPDLTHTIRAAEFKSLSRNTPFEAWQLKGRAVMTIVGGRIVYDLRTD